MENNQAYLKKLPQVFLILMAVCFLREFLFHYHSFVRIDQPSTGAFMVNEILLGAVFFLGLGCLLNKWKIALIALGVFVIILCLDNFFISKYQLASYPKPLRIFLFISISTLYYFPYLLFFLLQKIPPRKVLMIAVALLLTRGFVPFYSFSSVYELMDKIFGKNVLYHDLFNALFYTSLGTVRLILYCQLQNYVDGKATVKNMLLLNPGNDYSKANGTIVFWSIKTFIPVICVALGYYAYSMRYYSDINHTGLVLVFYYQLIIQMLLTLFVMIFFTWYLRKFLLEYCITYNINSKLIYWLLLLPIVGFFVWLFLLAMKKTGGYEEKIVNIGRFTVDSSRPVTIVYSTLVGIQLIFLLTEIGQQRTFFYTLFTLSLFAWTIFSRTGYKVNLWLRIAGYSTVLLWLFFKVGKEEAFAMSFVYPVLLYGIIQLLLLYPIYHFDSFVYLSKPEPESNSEPTTDLLHEFDPA